MPIARRFWHLLVEMPRGDLSAGMRSVNGRYAQAFNRRHRRRGHLFEGRFRAILVQKNSHLLELSRYVVFDPVRAKIVERTEQWRWSNYRMSAGLSTAPASLMVDWTLARFARTWTVARLRYRQFVRASRAPRRLSSRRGPDLFGQLRGQACVHVLRHLQILDEFADLAVEAAILRQFALKPQHGSNQCRSLAPELTRRVRDRVTRNLPPNVGRHRP